MDLFFSPDIQLGDFAFNREESKHIIRVLRRKTGDEIFLTNGKGYLFKGIITEDNPIACLAEIIDKKLISKPGNSYLHIAIAPTKNINRLEWFIEKATEIGIDEITPIKCDHSERSNLKMERLEKILISAIKQSQQLWLPKLNPMMPLRNLINRSFNGQKFIAFVDTENKTSLKSAYHHNQDCLILIGPEGDFSEEEVRLAISAGYLQISLGENRLRTETAALVACHTINLINQ
jgi:16S rRNA (uracil1498-N3)-methyltransferase